MLHDEGHVSASTSRSHKLYNQGMIQAFAYQDARGAVVPTKDTEVDGDRVVHRRDAARS